VTTAHLVSLPLLPLARVEYPADQPTASAKFYIRWSITNTVVRRGGMTKTHESSAQLAKA
jgi:hypothetical protein